MKKNLNEQVSRIKDMMKKINESQFDEIFDRPNDDDTQYERFKNKYHEELWALKKSLQKVTPDMLESLSDEKQQELENVMNNYDEDVFSSIDHWVYNPKDFSVRDIVMLAIENSDRYGTEPQMVIYAMEDYLKFFGINPFVEDEDEDDQIDEPSSVENDDYDEKMERNYGVDDEPPSRDEF